MLLCCIILSSSGKSNASSRGSSVPQNGTPRDTVHLPCRPPPASTGSCSSSLHGLLFIQPPPRATPPATIQPPLHGHPPPSTVHPALHTMGSCSTTPPWAPLHRLLFIQPSTTPRGPVHPEATPPLTVHPPPPPQCSLFIPSIGFS